MLFVLKLITLTTKEVFKEILSIHKWYARIGKSQQWGFSMQVRFNKGQVKQSTMAKVFERFGYEQNEVTWKKKS